VRRWLAIVAAIVLSAATGHADEPGSSMPATPEAIEAAPAEEPIVVRQENAAALFGSVPLRTNEPAPTARGVKRVYTADVPPKPVVNPTSHFVFEDATERPASVVKPLSEREAAVEALRQSMRGAGGGTP